ncbi:MAG: NPCBM/NEW2 domain-containing protein [Armatimonadota bacterium]|nr:NPCBM/NEW2 domain-containing protein [bacterium]
MRLVTVLLGGMVLMNLCAGSDAAQPATAIYISDMQDRIASARQGWSELGVDIAAYLNGSKTMPLQIKDKTYAKGLGSHAPGEIVLDLNGEFSRFEAEVGVQWQLGGGGLVAFQVFADGKKVFETGAMGESTAAEPVSIDVSGVQELRLVCSGKGDGVMADYADWADARLVPDLNATKQYDAEQVNLASFGRTVTYDPSRNDGARNGRTGEFAAEDLFLETDVVPNADGAYVVPKAADGRGCIGLQWLERRRLSRIGVLFADNAQIPSKSDVQVEYWVMTKAGSSPGGSNWQGKWEPLKGNLTQNGNRWIYDIDWANSPNRRTGTLKVRWIFAASAMPVSIRELTAYSDSKWKTTGLVLQLENPLPGKTAEIKVYNGEIVGSDANTLSKKWDLSQPLNIRVRYDWSKSRLTDRTVVRVKLPGAEFGVAVDDILANGCVYFKDAGFFATSEAKKISLADYKKQIAGKKTVLERVNSMPDQTFEQAMEHVHRAAADNGPTMLSLACNNHKFAQYKDGHIEWDNDPAVYDCIDHEAPHWYACHFRPEFGSGNRDNITRHLTDGWIPIPVMSVTDNGVVYNQRTFVAPYDKTSLPADKPVWWNEKPLCVVEITIENPQAMAADVRAKLEFLRDYNKGLQAELKVVPSGVVAYRDDKPVAVVNSLGASALKGTIVDGAYVLSGVLPAKSQVRILSYIPGWAVSEDEIVNLKGDDDLAAATVAYWHKVMAEGMQVDIPNATLENAIKASQVHCMLAARNHDAKSVAPWIGSISYGPLESEAQSIIRGMEFMGNTDFSRRGLDYFLNKVNDKGYLTTGYTLMGTGWMLWSLGEYYDLTKDSVWLKSAAPTVVKMCDWIIAQRRKTMKVDAFGNRVPEWGLMPPGVMADWEVYAYYMYLNGYYYAGLNAAGRALADIGDPAAKRVLENAEDLKQQIMRAFKWTQSQAPLFPLQNGTWVPEYPTHVYCPSPIENFYKGEDFGRSWCYDVELGAHHIIPQGVMDPNSKDARWMMDHMEDVQFIADGWTFYPAEQNRKDWFNLGGFAKVQPYYARNAEIYAKQDDVKAFVRSYFNTIISLLNREDLSLWEHFHNGAYNKTHETGYFLHQSATMMVMTRGDQLWLAPFVTNNWLKDGMTVAAKKAPTGFGCVSYSINSHAAEGYIEAVIAPPTREMPREIVLRLRHPEGKKMKSVTVNGVQTKDFDNSRECVTIRPTGAGNIIVRADY